MVQHPRDDLGQLVAPVALDELEIAPLADRHRADLGPDIAQGLLRHPDVGLDHAQDLRHRLALPMELQGRNHQTFLEDVPRVGGDRARRASTDVDVVAQRRGDRDQVSVVEDRLEDHDVRVMGASLVGVIQDDDVFRVERECPRQSCAPPWPGCPGARGRGRPGRSSGRAGRTVPSRNPCSRAGSSSTRRAAGSCSSRAPRRRGSSRPPRSRSDPACSCSRPPRASQRVPTRTDMLPERSMSRRWPGKRTTVAPGSSTRAGPESSAIPARGRSRSNTGVLDPADAREAGPSHAPGRGPARTAIERLQLRLSNRAEPGHTVVDELDRIALGRLAVEDCGASAWKASVMAATRPIRRALGHRHVDLVGLAAIAHVAGPLEANRIRSPSLRRSTPGAGCVRGPW